MSLDFFNSLGGTINIELSEEPYQVGQLLNQFASKTAKILSAQWTPHVYEEDDVRSLTPEELDQMVLEDSEIKIRSHACLSPSEVQLFSGGPFTVRDMVKVINQTEFQTRGETDWFGGPDVHHIFFEGISKEKEIWTICWGS